MKKQFFVKLSLISLLFVLVSCASIKTINSDVVDTALNLANKQVELGHYEDALNTYNLALRDGYDYKLLYNKALVQAKLKDYESSIETLKTGYKKYPEHTEFLSTQAKMYYLNNNIDGFISAYDLYLKEEKDNYDETVIYINLLKEQGLNENAYNLAHDLWYAGYDTEEVVDTLYSFNPEKWAVVKNVLFD